MIIKHISGSKMPRCVKSWQHFDGPLTSGASEFNRESEEPLQGAKMTVMDILELRAINGLAPKGKIWTN